MPLVLDAIAHRYHADPDAVLSWSPERLGMALICLRAHDEHAAARAKGGGVMAVWTLNG